MINLSNKEIIVDQDNLIAMQMIMQSSQAYQLMKLRKLEESKIPTRAIPMVILVVNKRKISFNPHWISLSLFNNGPGNITVWTNSDIDPNADNLIPPNGNIDINMVYPVLSSITIKTTGGNALVSIIGKEGRNYDFSLTEDFIPESSKVEGEQELDTGSGEQVIPEKSSGISRFLGVGTI